MTTGGWFVLIHTAFCLLLLLLRLTGRLKCRYINLLTAAMIPVFGAAILIITEISDRNREREARHLELEQMQAREDMKSITQDMDEGEVIPLNEAMVVNDSKTRRNLIRTLMYDINRSVTRDPDDLNERAVPLEEALILNDVGTRRSLMLDVMYANPADFVSQLFTAKSNSDTEVVHYAATALTEIQKDYDIRFLDITRRMAASPEDPRLEAEYQTLLESYITSGLLRGDGLHTHLQKLSDLLAKRLGEEDHHGRWGLLNKKAEADLQLKDAAALREDVRQMQAGWPERENTLLYRLRLAVLEKNPEDIRRIRQELRDSHRYISPELRSIMAFWEGEQGDQKEEPAGLQGTL